MRGFLFTLSASVAFSLGAAAPAFANEDAVSVEVSTRNLDLTKAADVKRLHRKLGRAATKVCASPGRRSVPDNQIFAACRSRALSDSRLKADRAVAAAHGQGAGAGSGMQAIQ